MAPIFNFRENKTIYTTEKTQVYSLEKRLNMVDILMKYIKETPGAIAHLQSKETTPTQKLIQIFLSGNLLSTDEMEVNLSSYSKLPRETKHNIKILITKIKRDSIDHLLIDDVELLKNCLTLLISNRNVENPQRNKKANALDSLKQEKLDIKPSIIDVQLPRDWGDLEQALNNILICQDEFYDNPSVEKIDIIHSSIREALVSQFHDQVKQDCKRLEHKSGEIIIVSDDWEMDDEIKAGLIIRDKAHIKYDGFSIVLTASELARLLDLSDYPPLSNIYKISTITHPNDFNFIYNNISRLANLCCSASDQPSQLREITLRQCFSAGRRNPKILGEVARSDVVGEAKLSEPDQQKIQQMLKHAPNINPETMKDLFELQTKSTQVLTELDEEVAVDRLIAVLKKNSELKEKIPHLIVKGYFGPVKPFPASAETHTFLPGDEKPPPGITSPNRFFKAARYLVFENDEHPESMLVQHIKRRDS